MKPSQLLFFSLILTPLSGLAAGLGELQVHSELGAPLRATVPVTATPGETLDSSCFRLDSIESAELPVIRKARLMLEQRRDGLLLHIEGNQPLAEPLAMLRVHAACGVEVQRDFFVMPALPESRLSAASTAQEGLQPAGTVPAAAASQAAAQGANATQASQPERQARTARDKTRVAKREKTARQASPRRGDRLVVSEELASLSESQNAFVRENDDRMLRMETSLARLSESLQALDHAIELGAQAQAASHELQLALALQDPPAAGPVGRETGQRAELMPAGETPAWRQWLELMLGAMVGGVLSALLLQRAGQFIPGYRRQ